MINVKIELWLWLDKKLSEDFKSASDMRSELEIKLEEDTTVRKLFGQLSERYPVMREKVFHTKKQVFYEDIVVTLNEKVMSPYKIYETKLKEGDKIIVLPVYAGG